MKIYFVAIVMLIIGFGAHINVAAAPAPTLFAFNDATKQCGTFRDGDERVSYNLPKDWQTYNYQKSMAKSTQDYCAELGYTNIGSIVDYLKLKPKILRTDGTNFSNQTSHFNYPLAIASAFIILGLGAIFLFLILKKSKKS